MVFIIRICRWCCWLGWFFILIIWCCWFIWLCWRLRFVRKVRLGGFIIWCCIWLMIIWSIMKMFMRLVMRRLLIFMWWLFSMWIKGFCWCCFLKILLLFVMWIRCRFMFGVRGLRCCIIFGCGRWCWRVLRLRVVCFVCCSIGVLEWKWWWFCGVLCCEFYI